MKPGLKFEDLEIGMFHEDEHVVSEQDVIDFARISGDHNPLHMDEEYAKTTIFGERVAHGALTASYVSAILGNELPGPGAIFTDLNLRFKRPVKIGDTVTARAEVSEMIERGNRVTLAVKCTVEGKVVIQGEAKVMVPSKGRLRTRHAAMQCFRSLMELPQVLRGCAIALGNFDGLHNGHRAVIDLARLAAGNKDAPLGVVMFDPPPRAFFQPDASPFRIMSMERRALLLDELGVDFCLALPFDQSIASMTDEIFCRSVLRDGLGVSAVSVGFDFCYGKGRMGNVDTLERFGAEMGFEVLVADKVEEATEKASSTQIRKFIREGNLSAAAHALHGWWRISGEVEHGEKRGRTLGYPTLNLTLGDMLHPRHGVYAVWARFEGEAEWRTAVASFGRTPTTGLRDPLLEVFIFDWNGDAYDRKVEVAFGKFLRGEEKFDSLDQLVAQMDQDSDDARAFLSVAEAPK